MKIDFLTIDDVLAIHEDQIERFGGGRGVRDPGLLEAALFRPRTGYYETVLELGAALWESLSQNHPFVDGNKRAAFASTYTFLYINGWEVVASDLALQKFLLPLYEVGGVNFENLLSWLQDNTSELS